MVIEIVGADETLLDEASDLASDLLMPIGAMFVGLAVALIVSYIARRAMRGSANRWPLLGHLSERVRWPLRLTLGTIGIWTALALTIHGTPMNPSLQQALTIILVASVGWLLIEITRAVQDSIEARFPTSIADNRQARRIHTQVQILGRLAIALIVVMSLAAILLSFPGMRAVGASILASAGLAAIVAGIAAQSALANVFAGLQVAFADSIRVDDVVIVEEEWGRIEQITLTYVVVRIWDDRRMIVPSTYFTNTPFENWTRRASDIIGTVEIDVDWTVSMDGMRAELDRLLQATNLWDGRTAGLQVTEATGGLVRVRALASAVSAPILWDLRCYLREGLITWVQQSGSGLPRTRLQNLPG